MPDKKLFSSLKNGAYYIAVDEIYQKIYSITTDGAYIAHGEPITDRRKACDHTSKKVIPLHKLDITKAMNVLIKTKQKEYRNG